MLRTGCQSGQLMLVRLVHQMGQPRVKRWLSSRRILSFGGEDHVFNYLSFSGHLPSCRGYFHSIESVSVCWFFP